MKCKICDNDTINVFSTQILNKYSVKYYFCNHCNFLQTEEPYWLDESYNSPINITDTGIMSRNIMLSQVTAIIIEFLFKRDDKFLDFAGGYGIFTRLMRDMGFDFYWGDPYCPNLFARGFELQNKNSKFDLVTSFESFEHFVKPIEDIEKMMKYSDNILFSTMILPSPTPKPEEWWYYGSECGQHISFYSYKTLTYIARKYDMKLCSNGRDIHLFTKDNNINNWKFNFLLKLRYLGFAFYIKRKMRSLTMNDMNYIISKIKNTGEKQ